MKQGLKTQENNQNTAATPFLQRSGIIFVLALFCNALWGSAFPSIKTGYAIFQVESGDAVSQIVFAGTRFLLAGILAILMGSVVQRKLSVCEKKEQTQLAEEIEIQYGTTVKKVKAENVGHFYLPKKPVISHEIGQYFIYPDFSEIDQYTGVLTADNFKIFKMRLEEAGLGALAADYTEKSGMLAAACYKLEIEAARRSRHIAGYQILDLQDFNGQGTATVGILNSFMKSKGIITEKEWNAFNGETVVLARCKQFVKQAGEPIEFVCEVSHYGATDLSGCCLQVCFGAWKKEFACDTIAAGLQQLAACEIPTQNMQTCQETLHLALYAADGSLINENHYSFYLYAPTGAQDSLLEALKAGKSVQMGEILFTTSEEEAMEYSRAQKKHSVVFGKAEHGIEGTYCSDFWNYPMFRSISEAMQKPEPVGTLGLLIEKEHPLMTDFLSEAYTTPQWYHLVMQGNAAILDQTDVKVIVRVMDNVERNHNLAILYEKKANVHTDAVMLRCTVDPEVFLQYPETKYFFEAIARYMKSK